jgi:uracil-DNA glycosylase family 4
LRGRGEPWCSVKVTSELILCSWVRLLDAMKTCKGSPLSDRLGSFLTKIIQAIQLRREDVYIANIINAARRRIATPSPMRSPLVSPFLSNNFR